MDVVSLCPLRVGSLVWRPTSGGFALTVICKGTYDLAPGELRLAEQQDDPTEDDDYWDDDQNRSVRAPSDLVPFKGRADVVLVGQAFAPGKMPTRSLRVRLVVGAVDKSIEIHGDRMRSAEGVRAASFTTMHLRYERAAFAQENPVGVRVDPRTGPLPNLQPPGRGLEPTGFGPISPKWSSRRARLGRHAGTFPPPRYADQPIPEDLDIAFFNAAPVDQQPERLEPGERVALENLSPKHASLVAELPHARPRAFVERGRGLEEIALTCDTLWIDTDRAVCTLTWRGQIGLHGPTDPGRVNILYETQARQLTWPEIQEQCLGRSAPAPIAAAGIPGGPGGPPAPAPTVVAPAAPDTYPGDQEPKRQAGPGRRATREFQVPGVETPARIDSALPFFSGPGTDRPPPPRATPAARPPWMEANVAAPMAFEEGEMNETVLPGALRVPSARWPPASRKDPMTGPMPVVPGPAAGMPPPLADAQRVPPVPPPVVALPQVPAVVAQVAPVAPPPLTLGQVAAPALTVGQIAAPPAHVPRPIEMRPDVGPNGSPVLTASNVAADPEAWRRGEARDARPAEAAAKDKDKGRVGTTDVVDLLWFDPSLPDRVRVDKQWFEAVAKMRPLPDDSPDEEPLPEPPGLADRQDVFAVLTEGEPTGVDDLEACLADATTPRGAFTPPLVMMNAELSLGFDDLETLKATLQVAAPFASGPDKRLKDAFDAATETVKAWTGQGSSRALDTLRLRVVEAFAPATPSLPPTYLDQGVERALVEQRRYEKRTAFGETWLRAFIGPRNAAANGAIAPASAGAAPVFLPEAVGQKLPLFTRFPARIIAEVHLPQEPWEPHPAALKCLAIARIGSVRAPRSPAARRAPG